LPLFATPTGSVAADEVTVAEDAPPKFTLRIDAFTSKKMACARHQAARGCGAGVEDVAVLRIRHRAVASTASERERCFRPTRERNLGLS
jgi:hypothetical protein